jgi:hypothetical protein
MTKMLDLIESYLEQTGHKPCRIDGSMPFEVRSCCVAAVAVADRCLMLSSVFHGAAHFAHAVELASCGRHD